MEKNEVIILEDRGFIQVNGVEAKDFLQNIVTNDVAKVTDKLTVFSSILTPQGKYLFDFFIIKLKDSYLLECEKKSTVEIIKLLNHYKLRSKIDLIDLSGKYKAAVISLEKFKEIENSDISIGKRIDYQDNLIYIDTIYNPKQTKMIKFFRSKNIQTSNGLDMLIYQGQKSFYIWNKINPEVDNELINLLEKNIK